MQYLVLMQIGKLLSHKFQLHYMALANITEYSSSNEEFVHYTILKYGLCISHNVSNTHTNLLLCGKFSRILQLLKASTECDLLCLPSMYSISMLGGVCCRILSLRLAMSKF